jgi:hypothetical protein
VPSQNFAVSHQKTSLQTHPVWHTVPHHLGHSYLPLLLHAAYADVHFTGDCMYHVVWESHVIAATFLAPASAGPQTPLELETPFVFPYIINPNLDVLWISCHSWLHCDMHSFCCCEHKFHDCISIYQS